MKILQSKFITLSILSFCIVFINSHNTKAENPMNSEFLEAIQKNASLDPYLMRFIEEYGISPVEFKDEFDTQNMIATKDIAKSPSGDQGNSGRCWIFGGEKLLGEKARQKWGKDFSFSRNWFAFWDKVERANFYLEKIKALSFADHHDLGNNQKYDREIEALGKLIGDGGEWELFKNIVKKYGAVPEYSMPDKNFSTSSAGFDGIIKQRLLLAGAKIYKLAMQSKASHSQTRIDEIDNEIAAIKLNAMSEVYRVLTSYLGQPPKEVIWKKTEKKGKSVKEVKETYSPQEFLALSKADLDEYAHIVDLDYLPRNTFIGVKDVGNVVEGELLKAYNIEAQEVKSAILKSIHHGDGVGIANEMCGFDQERCILSKSLNEEGNIFKFDNSCISDVGKGDRLLIGIDGITHMMYIVGYQLKVGADQKSPRPEDVRYWHTQNSWQSAPYVWMDNGWFDQYAYGWIIKKKYLKKSTLTKMNKAKTQWVPAWDPFGKITLGN